MAGLAARETEAGLAPARGMAPRRPSGAVHGGHVRTTFALSASVPKAPARRDGQALALRLRRASGEIVT